jgi:hypothetical protein
MRNLFFIFICALIFVTGCKKEPESDCPQCLSPLNKAVYHYGDSMFCAFQYPAGTVAAPWERGIFDISLTQAQQYYTIVGISITIKNNYGSGYLKLPSTGTGIDSMWLLFDTGHPTWGSTCGYVTIYVEP